VALSGAAVRVPHHHRGARFHYARLPLLVLASVIGF
jgi:hypothetical protein